MNGDTPTDGEHDDSPDPAGAGRPPAGRDDSRLIDSWYAVGRANHWIAQATDPPFTRRSFHRCDSLEELKERIGHGNWCLGQAFHHLDLCFINQVDGGDEWLTIRHGVAFESITFGPSIRDGTFEALIGRLPAAGERQCRRLE
jgi:hypothetical protein